MVNGSELVSTLEEIAVYFRICAKNAYKKGLAYKIFCRFVDAAETAAKQNKPIKPVFLPEHKFGCPCGVIIGMMNPYCWNCGKAIDWKVAEDA